MSLCIVRVMETKYEDIYIVSKFDLEIQNLQIALCISIWDQCEKRQFFRKENNIVNIL